MKARRELAALRRGDEMELEEEEGVVRSAVSVSAMWLRDLRDWKRREVCLARLVNGLDAGRFEKSGFIEQLVKLRVCFEVLHSYA